MSDVERGTSKDKYLTGNSKRTFVDQKRTSTFTYFSYTEATIYSSKWA